MNALNLLQEDTYLLYHQAAWPLRCRVPLSMSIDLGTRSTTTSSNGTARPKKPLKHICFADIDGEGIIQELHSTSRHTVRMARPLPLRAGTLVHFPNVLQDMGQITQPSVRPFLRRIPPEPVYYAK